MTYVAIVLTVGVVTYLSRLSFIAAFSRARVPRWLESPLRYVAPAVLAALVTPAVFAPDGTIDLGTSNPRFLAGVVAALVAWRTRSVVWTIVTGMAALWALDALF